MVKGAVEQVWLPRAKALVAQVAEMARELKDVPLLAHTHGQPATPTTMGKELAVLAHRLGRQLRRIEGQEYLGKFNGATGTFGAHALALPDVDWPAVSRAFVEGLGLTWNPLTTQIESHDWQAELYADVARFNRILHNLCTDVWTYISMGYFAQVRGQGTVGSSTMPHKVNPIRFENAEANLEVSNALLDVLGGTLVQSRLQRDLTDSIDAAQHRHGLRPLAARPRQRRAAVSPASTPCPSAWPPTSRPTGRCSASRSSRRCGPSAHRASRAWRSPTSGSRS